MQKRSLFYTAYNDLRVCLWIDQASKVDAFRNIIEVATLIFNWFSWFFWVELSFILTKQVLEAVSVPYVDILKSSNNLRLASGWPLHFNFEAVSVQKTFLYHFTVVLSFLFEVKSSSVDLLLTHIVVFIEFQILEMVEHWNIFVFWGGRERLICIFGFSRL